MNQSNVRVLDLDRIFFIGVAGAGMSAIAQYLAGNGKVVKGSDRLFTDPENEGLRQQLEAEHVQCFLQDGSGIDENTQAVIVSTAIEDSNIEVAKANALNIPIVLRADLLAEICDSKQTIAIAGTSGKSTTTAMLFHILHHQGLSPSLISGAGLVSLQKQGKIGNAYCGQSNWLIIEADESDGTLVKYKPEIGVLLSIDKDHKELDELFTIFQIFRSHTLKHFIVNRSHALAAAFSSDQGADYGQGTAFDGSDFSQQGFNIRFTVQGIRLEIPTIGKHNMENALACIAVASLLGVSIQQCADALKVYEGIYRRHQLMGTHKGIVMIDDYAHNPAKIAASIRACQEVGDPLIAWFQPHGYGPTRFIRKELVEEISKTLRKNDQVWMSEIYYAGGTAVKDISAEDLINDLKQLGIHAEFRANRDMLFRELIPELKPGSVLLLMGARDPGLEKFAHSIWQALQQQ